MSLDQSTIYFLTAIGLLILIAPVILLTVIGPKELKEIFNYPPFMEEVAAVGASTAWWTSLTLSVIIVTHVIRIQYGT